MPSYGHMRTLLAFFVLTTVTFAATTTYFALQLHARENPAESGSIAPPHKPLLRHAGRDVIGPRRLGRSARLAI
jgi:hypothetical protein